MRSAPSRLAARTPDSPTAPSPTTATVLPGRDVGADGGVVAGRHHVRERQQRGEHLVGVPGAGDRDERAVGERDADRLALAAVAVGRVEAAGDAGGRDAVPAVRARAVAEGERRDDEVALADVRDVGADVLDDADELVADRPGLERRVAAVVPEVRAADAGEHDADDRVGRLDDGRVGPVADLDPVGFDEEGCTHEHQGRPASRGLGGPVKGVLPGTPVTREFLTTGRRGSRSTKRPPCRATASAA